MSRTKTRERLPDIAAHYYTHLSFCMSGAVDERMLREAVGVSGEAPDDSTGFAVAEYSRRKQPHWAALIVDPPNEAISSERHCVVWFEARPWPANRGAVVIRNRVFSTERELITVGSFETLLSTLQFTNTAEPHAYLDAHALFPKDLYAPYVQVPMPLEDELEIVGLRFATKAPEGSVIVDVGSEESTHISVTVQMRAAFDTNENSIEGALEMMNRQILPFLETRECGNEART